MTLGKKGEALVKMCRWGLPVPPGIILSAETCQEVREQGVTPQIRKLLQEHLDWFCNHTKD